jgi:opacity protein-like surface antigen
MKTAATVTLIVLLCVGTSFSTATASGVSGRIGLGLGAAMPRGQANRYTDNSFAILLYGGLPMPGLAHASFRLGFQAIFLESEDHDVNLDGWDFTESYSTDLMKFTLGSEVAPRLGVLQPFVGGGVGLYHFFSTVTLKDPGGDHIDKKTLSSETDFGWNLNGGLRIYFMPKWSVLLSAEYDKIMNMEHLKAADAGPTAALGSEELDIEYLSLFVGVQGIIP